MALLGSCWEILVKRGALMSWNGGSGGKQRRMAFQQRGLKKTGKESVRALGCGLPEGHRGTAIVPAQVRPGPRASHEGSVERLPLGRQPHNSSLPPKIIRKMPPSRTRRMFPQMSAEEKSNQQHGEHIELAGNSRIWTDGSLNALKGHKFREY